MTKPTPAAIKRLGETRRAFYGSLQGLNPATTKIALLGIKENPRRSPLERTLAALELERLQLADEAAAAAAEVDRLRSQDSGFPSQRNPMLAPEPDRHSKIEMLLADAEQKVARISALEGGAGKGQIHAAEVATLALYDEEAAAAERDAAEKAEAASRVEAEAAERRIEARAVVMRAREGLPAKSEPDSQ